MRNHVLLFFAILLSFCASAQLTVRQSSYIFVDGAGFTDAAGVAPLFVTDEVNIVEPGSRIYLRNEAQIIQGTGTTGNSGEGELSVYQEGNTNQWAYNYWCSPIGNNSNTNGNEAARVNLIDESTGLTSSVDAAFITAYNGTSSPLTISSRWLYTFVVSDEYSEWVSIDETSNIPTGLGFTMKGMGTSLVAGASSQRYDFRGKPNSGTITNNIASEQFTFMGNPYPSALDAADFLWDPQNVNLDEVNPVVPSTTGALYYWEQAPNSNSHYIEDYVGGYASYTCTQPDGSDNIVESFVAAPYQFHLSDGSVAGTPPAGSGSHVARRYIPIGQGFMVEGAVGIPSTSLVYVKNSHRNFYKETSTNSEFFRTTSDNNDDNTVDSQYDENGYFLVPSEYKRFRILTSFNDLYSRELLANFHSSATEGFDYGLEAKMPESNASDINWIQDNENYVIQAHNFELELRIPLVLTLENQQLLRFGVFDVQNFDVSQPIFLHDIDENIYVDLRTQNYSINLPSGIYDSRFEITFQSETLSTTEITDEDFDVFQNTKDSVLTILNPNGLDIQSVSVFDISGKSVISATHVGNQSNYHYSTKSLSDGVYVASIHTENNQVISKKVIIKN
ncbi:T9SS type A sorting domain-containing protein [Psychroserpens algicola]|uniref:T9SS type A sorting domain-containing protein n=1 Tax=Psychroserpens algicola TaxID=1719034 RepID=UPI001953FEC6|nr:T9SS type A sorting domain-containing protein [Psychroserpens algicola]